MKRSIFFIIVTAIIISATIYLGMTLFSSKSANGLTNQNSLKIQNTVKATSDLKYPLSLKKLTQNVIDKEVVSFEKFLEKMPTHDQDKYIKLNEYFFGALAFSSAKEYAMLKEQGFPSLKEINYVMEYSRKDLNQALRNNISAYPQYTDNPELNLSSISSVNLVTTIEELENEIKYYLPEYKQYTPLPSKDEYTNNEYPIQVQTAMSNLINSYSVVMSYTAIEFLAEARYAQLVKNNTKSVLTKLAMANKKLQGNDNILNYVKKHYPEELDTYIDLTNTL
jgi:hypothetical protein